MKITDYLATVSVAVIFASGVATWLAMFMKQVYLMLG